MTFFSTRFRPTLALVAVALSVVFGCKSAGESLRHERDATRPHETLNATVWMQLSAEYRAAATQAYNSALAHLPDAIADTSWSAIPGEKNVGSKPTAIIVDVDETVLDNSPFEARVIRADSAFNRPWWNAWVEERRATAVPGALRFLSAAAERGVTIYYVTNRNVELDAATTDNLDALGFPLTEGRDVVLTRGERPEWTGDKQTRRQFVADEFRVLFLAGDDLNDFVSTDVVSSGEGDVVVATHERNWGERWILLPNPAYGSWERTITSEAGARSRHDQIRAKVAALRDR
ncbi:MAG: HAD family acid phosphatase [Rhodothermales bacterium]|nr:HAD family acid phosphatase [Rhodothermales bacterium]